MTHRMERYKKALEHGMHVPPMLMRENVQQMKNIERLFEQKVRKLQVAVGRKDYDLLEKTITDIEMVIENAKEFLRKVKADETDS